MTNSEKLQLEWIYVKAFILLEQISNEYDENTESSKKSIWNTINEAKKLKHQWEELRNVSISKTNQE